MKNKKQETPISLHKRASREQFYSKLSKQRKLLSQDIKDLRVLNTLKSGFTPDEDFEMSETDKVALQKHNAYMENESNSKINTVESDIRLASAIARGK